MMKIIKSTNHQSLVVQIVVQKLSPKNLIVNSILRLYKGSNSVCLCMRWSPQTDKDKGKDHPIPPPPTDSTVSCRHKTSRQLLSTVPYVLMYTYTAKFIALKWNLKLK